MENAALRGQIAELIGEKSGPSLAPSPITS